MSKREILDQALRLNPADRFAVVEGILRSLDEPDQKLDAIWVEEAERRLAAYREGRMHASTMEEIFKDEP